MDRILGGLNDAQTCAVSSPSTVLQVLAPPGSGKTKTLTARVAYLIAHEKFRPWNIIVCTFTNKAAREMKERIQGFLGDDLEKRLVLGTFHAVALRYLRAYGRYIGVQKDFGIADTTDTMGILKRIRARHKYQMEPGVARSRISKMKAKCETVWPLKDQEKEEFEAIFEEYEGTLKTSNLLDYDDLLLRCSDLLRSHPDCVSNIEAVLIDEFQDTNHVQYELMSLFSQRHNRITIVGDPDQSIYSFRSAEVKNVLKMQEQYSDSHVVHLEENYRSSGSILLSALGVIEQDESRPQKKLLPTHTTGTRPVLRRLPDPWAEGVWIVEELQRVKQLSGDLLSYGDFAILIRSGFQSQAIELALGKAGVPYRMVGGHKFFERWEIKILLNYLRVINMPNHNDAIIQVINEPSRGVGDETVRKLVDEAERRKIPFWQLVQNIAQERGQVETKVRTAQRRGISEFFGIITKARKKMDVMEGPTVIAELLDFIIGRLSMGDLLHKKFGLEIESRLENIEELRTQAVQFCSELENPSSELRETLPAVEGIEQLTDDGPAAALSQFLANVALATDSPVADNQEHNQVTISTMHGAKGLEWPVVFVASVYEGSLPHSRAEDHDEERRLLYVAMTRAQALLYLSCPRRVSRGDGCSGVILSSFLSSRDMSDLFDTKGTSMWFSVVQDLARILRRICPSESLLIEAFSAATLREDDRWPEDGSDIQTEGAGRQTSDVAETGDSERHKRRRLGAGHNNIAVAHFSAMTTMQSGSSFSVPVVNLSTSFTTAASCLQQHTVTAPASNKRSYAPDAMQISSSRSKMELSTKPSGSKGSLMSFFEKIETATAHTPTKSANSRSNEPRGKQDNNDTEKPQRPSHGSAQAIPPDHSSFRRTISSVPLSQLRESRIQSKSITGKHPTSLPEDARENINPTKPDGQGPVEGLSACGHSPASDDKPASTFHTTSMAASYTNNKRTLGMRRNMQPSSTDRVHRPFKPLSRSRT